jgi:hypothetical protein
VKSKEYKDAQKKKIELLVILMHVKIYGDAAIKREDLKKLSIANIYKSPLLEERKFEVGSENLDLYDTIDVPSNVQSSNVPSREGFRKHGTSLGVDSIEVPEGVSRLSSMKRTSWQDEADHGKLVKRPSGVSFGDSRNSDIVKAEFRVSFD